ncbi:Maf family nucleotide pyrophosphatase [Flavobacterium sp. ASW18X]|uniref:Maf family nucleotide pyrophosphatase n=1 Tax=Flavobacterium sp. ASW18X TaxID=2572595 RepID=UPI0010AE5976|nr:Maf family nucleotide pyrophosphatase [Flavobacterium sp. ASW18X]TKD66240.1 septum formation protein Maf [Flavobacterium sp. ASW18X]
MIKNPLSKKLEGYQIILASGSPRRKAFLEELGIPYTVHVKPVDEVYPPELKGAEISDYLAVLKASAFKNQIETNQIVLTSDTVVWCYDESLAKAADEEEATQMLNKLSGQWHEVITSVCFTTLSEQKVVHSKTKVKLKTLTAAEIGYYINTFKPYDKAGAYGIQEWIGSIGIEEIRGSYNTVVGLPTHLVYKTLMDMAD